MSTWVDELILQYRTEVNQLDKYRKNLDQDDPLQAEESETVSGMISDLRFALDWMKHGRRPGNLRGIERTNIYRQREIMKELQSAENLEDSKKMMMILLGLSERERICFLLHMAHGLTFAEISARLKVSRATTQSYVTRARQKIQEHIS